MQVAARSALTSAGPSERAGFLGAPSIGPPTSAPRATVPPVARAAASPTARVSEHPVWTVFVTSVSDAVTSGTGDSTPADVTLTTEMSPRNSTVELPVLPGPRLDLPRPDIEAEAATAALIGDPVRAGILAILRDGPHCVCEMAAALEVRQNNLSNHLARLREAGLVRASRHKVDARWVYYERDEGAIAAAAEALTRVL